MNIAMQKAIDLVDGNQAEMARRLEKLSGEPVSPQKVRYWLHRRVPPRWAVWIETLVDGKVTREQLVFGNLDVAA